MGLDQQGYFWLSNPWTTAVIAVTAIGIVLWCHARLAGAEIEQTAAEPAVVRLAHPTITGSAPARTSHICPTTAKRERRHAQRRRVA